MFKLFQCVFFRSECQQVLFHRAARSHLLLVYQREVLILDMDIGQTVGIITRFDLRNITVPGTMTYIWLLRVAHFRLLLYKHFI